MSIKDYKQEFYMCDCFEEALHFYYDKEVGELYIDKFCYDGYTSGLYIIKNKIRNFFKVLFGETDCALSAVYISRDKVQCLLNNLKSATGYKPKDHSKESGLFPTYFYGNDTFDVLVIDPQADDNSFFIWMCQQNVFWSKSRWIRAWKTLKNGIWNKNSTFLDIDETKELMNYLNTMLKIKWEGYKDEGKE